MMRQAMDRYGWQDISTAPKQKAIWVVDMTASIPTAHLASYSQIPFSKEFAWRIADSRAQMVKPTHWMDVERPAVLPERFNDRRRFSQVRSEVKE